MLNAQIDRELHRLLLSVRSEARAVQIGEPATVEPFFDAGDALVVDIDVAEHVRDLRPVGIDALVLGEEADPRDAEAMHLDLLLCGDLALEPHEAALRAEALAQLGGVEIGHHRGQKLDRLVDIDDAARLGEQ